MLQTAHYDSPLGKLILAGEDGVLTGLWIEGQKYFPGCLPDASPDSLPAFRKAFDWLDRYFAGKAPLPRELALAPQGSTPFRQEVWQLLLDIPYGETTTYGELSREVARRRGLEHMSAQAVGGAVGHNPISIMIPCHRVLGADGSLTGYAGGLDRKRFLLDLEHARTKPDRF